MDRTRTAVSRLPLRSARPLGVGHRPNSTADTQTLLAVRSWHWRGATSRDVHARRLNFVGSHLIFHAAVHRLQHRTPHSRWGRAGRRAHSLAQALPRRCVGVPTPFTRVTIVGAVCVFEGRPLRWYHDSAIAFERCMRPTSQGGRGAMHHRKQFRAERPAPPLPARPEASRLRRGEC